jgi:hypothetical protein
MHLSSYLITYRNGADPARRANLQAVLAWLAGYAQFEVIVVEQDDTPRLEGPLAHPAARIAFAYNPGPFNKSWGLNLAYRLSSAPLLAFGDADVIVGSVIGDCANYLTGGYQAVKPYRRLIELDETESTRVRGGDFDWIAPRTGEALWPREMEGERLAYAGGLFLITRQAFAAAGGWDERFRGWGGEDDALSYRLERTRVPALELDTRPAVHLHHARLRENTFGQPHYTTNTQLLQDYRRYTDAELKRLAEVQNQFNGWRDKYRPPVPA